MRDPETVAFEIPNPFRWRKRFDGKWAMETLATVWHVDPETDGTDDSCGWFMRARHGDKETLEKIRGRFEFEWDAEYGGWFRPDGSPRLSVQGIVFNMIFLAALEHFGGKRDRAMRFCRRNLAEIVLFAENNCDSLHDGITQRYGAEKRDDRVKSFAGCTYSWILRAERPWYRHPRWHIHHWRIQVHAIQAFKRWAFSRCAACGKRFPWGYAPISSSWYGTGPRWFRSEKGVCHHACANRKLAPDTVESTTNGGL